jgi:acyl transferase domain-containing protein/NADPH:quinone reductase-like Zn-dependent oxidoreductase/thioesterase domain-containing protein/acyl carrier protein
MSANNFNMNYESCDIKAASEQYTYYPTWFNGKTTAGEPTINGIATTMPKSYNSMVEKMQKAPECEDIVISGVSGKFPESDNVEEFAANLYDGVDMVNEKERRWPTGIFGLPTRNGTIKDISQFDAEFFGISPKQVDNMDPQLRMLLETTYEAIFDSGLNPAELKGTRTGVFIGASGSDAQQAFSNDPENVSGYSMTGCATSMFANRLSYFFDFKGPSYVVDTACSSSLVALDAAINAIKTGQCDQAIVGGVQLLSRPQTSLQFQKLGMLSQEGKCKSFDAQGKGYVRSETIGAILIQKKSSCKRFYAKVLHSKVNTDGAKEQGITFPSGAMQATLLKEIYAECNIDPSLVTYVEAHGTGTKAGDPQELNSIAEVFVPLTSMRSVPLFIGSTKSNMGHSEPASGIAALIKMLISIQRGVIPANLHYQEPNQEVAALHDGRLKVVNENTKFRGGLMALNSFGFGGANAHVLLQPNNDFMLNRQGAASLWNQDISELTSQPRLFQFCARTQEGLEQVLDHMQANASDLAKQVLLQANSTCSPATHPHRGFTVLNAKHAQNKQSETVKLAAQHTEKRPVWFIFSGMGTQHQNMGQELMKIDTFRQSIMRSAETLKPYGMNLLDIMFAQQNAYERTLNAFVGIAATQIALVDCLRQAGIEADGIIGHSVGELGCAYADNCFSAEETILAAYWRGKCIENAALPMGAMAAVGLSWIEAQRRCPTGVVAACHNSLDTVTISGPKHAVAEFVQQLKSEGVFAKEVDSSNVAFHSYHMTSIAPELKAQLEKVIVSPKQRSAKWVSTSIAEQRWDSELARYSSPDYHVNNLCSPVLFQEALKHIPANAITVEVAPHALLQAILKRSLPAQVTCVPLMLKSAPSALEHFWAQLGKLYTEGINVNTVKLFVPVGTEHSIYPVPASTGFISALATWRHEQQWSVPKYQDFLLAKQTGNLNTNKYTIDLAQPEDAYLAGHVIDGRVIYPATGYMNLVWQTLAKMQQVSMEQLPVTFQNVEIHQATVLRAKEQYKQQQSHKVTLVVSIIPVTGHFEITEGDNVVCSGQCFTPEHSWEPKTDKLNWASKQNVECMQQDEIYKDLSLRGYEYSGEFQAIVRSDVEGKYGDLMWTGKWIPFLDAMLQMNVLSQKRGLMLPTRIQCLRIDPRFHKQCMQLAAMDNTTTNAQHIAKYNKYLQQSIKHQQAQIVQLQQQQTQQMQQSPKYVNGNKQQQQQMQMQMQQMHQQYKTEQYKQMQYQPEQYKTEQYKQMQWKTEQQIQQFETDQYKTEQYKQMQQQFETEKFENQQQPKQYKQAEQYVNQQQQFQTEQYKTEQYKNQQYKTEQYQPEQQYLSNEFDFEQAQITKQLCMLPISFDRYTNTIVCGGVEITGLHAQCAPRRANAPSSIVERVNFVPYVEQQFVNGSDEFTLVHANCQCADKQGEQCLKCELTTVDACTSERREFLEYYLAECQRHTAHILRKIEFPATNMQTIQQCAAPKQWTQKFDNNSIQQQQMQQKEQLTGSFSEYLQGGKLLQLLQFVANLDSTDGQYFYKVQKAFSNKQAYYKAMEEDRVLNYLTKRTSYLKSFLDTVLENTHFSEYKQQNKLKVLEISPSFNQFFGVKVNKFLKTHPKLSQMDYHYAPTGQHAAENTDELLAELNAQLAQPIQKSEWNLTLAHGSPLSAQVPKNLKDFDLVIFNGSLSTLLPYASSEFELKQWLQTVVQQVMKPQGFMFVHEFTGKFDTIAQLAQLEQVVFRQASPINKQIQQIQQQIQKPFQQTAQKFQTEQQWRQLIEGAGFNPVALKSDNVMSTMFLYRTPCSQFVGQQRVIAPEFSALSEQKIFIDDMEQYSWVEQIKSAMNAAEITRVWLISEQSPNSGIVGLVNCLRTECGGDKLRCIFIADKAPIRLAGQLVPTWVSAQQMHQQSQTTVQWTQLFEQLRAADMVMNVFRNGQWGSFRHMLSGAELEQLVLTPLNGMFSNEAAQQAPRQLHNAYINMQSRGDLSTLQWMQSPEPHCTGKQIHCQVNYAALNFRDIMLATGKLTPEAIPGYHKMQDGLLGMEFSGKCTKTATRYMGMVPAKGLATSVVCDNKHMWEVPAEWTLRQAATVPVAYATAYYALVVRGQLKQGESVLIHAGSGAVGQAAIGIALSYKCKVFVTVSSDEKRDFLKQLFAGQLSDLCFANSRDTAFEKHIMQLTRGAGVDMVLNSLSEDKLQASVRVLAQHGRFLEMGKFDLNKNAPLGMSAFLKNITFHGILVDSLFEGDNAEWQRVHQLVAEGIRSGTVKPLDSTLFEKHQIEEAFRFMAQGKHMGKVLVHIADQSKSMNAINASSELNQLQAQFSQQSLLTSAQPKVWFSPNKSYIVTGGLGGFGLELTQWMVERGARHMILTSRSGVRTGYQAKKLRNLQEEFNASIKVLPCDVKEEQGCRMLFAEAKKCPEGKIGGIFHLAAVLEDAVFDNMNAERFKSVADIKAKGTFNLDMFSRTEECMDDSAFFVVFSSVVSGRGNQAQSNYGFANSAMERICECRRRDGKHALAIQWGAIGQTGMCFDQMVNNGINEAVIGGTRPQEIASCLRTLELLILKSAEQRDQGVWSSFVPAEKYVSIGQFNGQQTNMQQQQKSIIELIANILGLKDVKQWRNEQISLGELGLDSLMNVEIKRVLEQMYNLPLNMREIQQLTMEKLRVIESAQTQTGVQQQQQMGEFVLPILTGIQSAKKTSFLMPTKNVEKLNFVEASLNGKHIPVVVIHPIEGHTNMLKSWAKQIAYPVYGVQYTEEAMRFDSVEQLADFYWQQVEQALSAYGPGQQVHLAGYSFGASVAFEMAAKRASRIASLTFLDGSHSYVNAHISSYKNKFQLENIHETEAEALCTFMQQYTQMYSRKQMFEELVKLPSFDQKVRFVVRELMTKSQFQFEAIDLEQAARSFVAKLFMSYKYQPKQMIRNKQVILIKPAQRTSFVQQALGEDYGLGQFVNGGVQVETVRGDHRSFLEGENAFQVAALMNEYLLSARRF